MTAYDHAVQELYQGPLASFVAERQRLAAKLRAAGDQGGAKQLAKRRRPTMSAWLVNQLYWRARDAFHGMLAAAARLRDGDAGAASDYRDAVASLRRRAATMRKEAGHGASEATLRRVTTTLAAVAAKGGFDPDPPGALSADRDPPGFEAVGMATRPVAHAAERAHDPRERRTTKRAPRDAGEAKRRAADQAEKRRREAERARRTSERRRLEGALRAAEAEVRTRERALSRLQKDVHVAEQAVAEARAAVRDLERQLADLGDDK